MKKIYQVSPVAINEENYVKPCELETEFNQKMCVSVYKSQNREGDITQLASEMVYRGIDYQGDGKFVIRDKKEYFRKKYENFTKIAENVAKMKIEDFVSDKSTLGSDISYLEVCYNAQYGIYVWNTQEDCCETLDEYIRYSNDGDEFFIGATMYY